MLKGVQKQIVQVQIPKNRYFESAYFILRPELRDPARIHSEMTKEANRILNESELLHKRGRSRQDAKKRRLISFLCGVLCGAMAVALLWFFVLLLT